VVAELADGEATDEAARFSDNRVAWFIQNIGYYDPFPFDLQIYRRAFRAGGEYRSPGWVLYYSPSMRKAYWTSVNY
jgi:hypothetical protein